MMRSKQCSNKKKGTSSKFEGSLRGIIMIQLGLFETEDIRVQKKAQRKSGLKTYIHVNQHIIKSNAKTGAREATLTCKTYKETRYAHEVVIHGDSKVVYSPDKPLSCGAKVWIETRAEVTCIKKEG